MRNPRPERSFMDLGLQYGLLVDGWGIEDYLLDAAFNEDGYETVAVTAVQGCGKSTRALQMLAWIKEEELRRKLGREPTERELWESVLEAIIFKPSELVSRLEAVPDNEPLTCLLWDDIGVHFTSSTYKTDIDQYAAIDATWAAIRTKVHVMLLTIPNITRLAKNLKDNLTFEVFIGKNQLEQVRRIFRLPGTKHIDSNIFKPIIGKPFKFDLYKVPLWAWQEYYKMRIKLANEALAVLRGVTDMEKLDNYIPIIEARILVREYDVNWSMSTIQQHVSRGVLRGQKLNGVLHIDKEYLIKTLKAEVGAE